MVCGATVVYMYVVNTYIHTLLSKHIHTYPVVYMYVHLLYACTYILHSSIDHSKHIYIRTSDHSKHIYIHTTRLVIYIC